MCATGAGTLILKTNASQGIIPLIEKYTGKKVHDARESLKIRQSMRKRTASHENLRRILPPEPLQLRSTLPVHAFSNGTPTHCEYLYNELPGTRRRTLGSVSSTPFHVHRFWSCHTMYLLEVSQRSPPAHYSYCMQIHVLNLRRCEGKWSWYGGLAHVSAFPPAWRVLATPLDTVRQFAVIKSIYHIWVWKNNIGRCVFRGVSMLPGNPSPWGIGPSSPFLDILSIRD